MKSNKFYALKKEIINQIVNIPFAEKAALIRLAMQTNDVEVRQSVAETISSIPFSFQSEYESLLNDKSYDTKQIAFSNLYKSFPESREKYLEIAKNWIGKNDKELRILYLTSYIDFHSKDENNSNKTQYLNELLDYTSTKYDSSIRKNALEYVLIIAPKNLKALKNLVNGTMHHKWQFIKYCRDEIRTLIKKSDFKKLFSSILSQLPENEQIQLNLLLVE
jgi:aminopeptidase N